MKKMIIILLIFIISIVFYSYNVSSMEYEDNFEINLLDDDYFKEILMIELNKKYPSFLVEELLNDTWNYDVLYNDVLVSSYSNILDEDIDIYIDCKELSSFNLGCIIDDNYQNKNIYKLDKDKKTVALTFDDGPSKYTKDIIDLLSDNKANATFFILGSNIDNYDEEISYILEYNNELGSHTYNHKILTRVKEKDLDNEINLTTNKIKEKYDYDIKLFRPPYGIINEKIRNEYDYSYILWSLDTLDWKNRSADKIYNNVIKNIDDGDIILMHDMYYSTYKALDKLLPELYMEGYQVTTVSNLAELKGYQIELKEKYNSFK